MTTKPATIPTRPAEGQFCLILRSACCDADMTGVEYGDHRACRACYQTGREWIEYLSPFRSTNYIAREDGSLIDVGAGPDPHVRVLWEQGLEAAKERGDVFWWG